jgi:hypothetical protein
MGALTPPEVEEYLKRLEEDTDKERDEFLRGMLKLTHPTLESQNC